MNFNNFKGAAKKLEDQDLPRLGAMIGVGEDEIHALIDVETGGGSGFDLQGRPAMLFEPHVFWRNTFGLERKEAENIGLAYPKWRRNYPADSYPRLHRAMLINPSAALMSASWGASQILGENFKMLNYSSVEAMVRAFMDDAEAHIRGMVDFCIANNIADDLRAHRWDVVARVYNGPGYKDNKYDIKLAFAFAKWKRIRDTPLKP